MKLFLDCVIYAWYATYYDVVGWTNKNKMMAFLILWGLVVSFTSSCPLIS